MCNLELFEQELRLNKSEKTVNVYVKQFKLFLDYFKDTDIRYLSESNIKSYILLLHYIYGYSAIVHAISAIKFYYSKINKRERSLNLPLPRKPKTIPSVLNISEVQKMIDCTLNLKHKAIISTMFSHGLRRSELINLKIKDIDSSNMILKVRQSKGLKDRNVPLSDSCLNLLREYYVAFSPNEYMFNGVNFSKYSETSLSNVIKSAANRARLTKNVTPHTLRHSFATYLVSININLAKIQEWLGHASSRTTEIYCHIINESNPIILKVA